MTEFSPRIGVFAPLPGWPESWSPLWALPYYGAWQASKVAARLPAVLAARRFDVTWLERELLPGYRSLESLLSRSLVLDVDDAIWMARPWGERSVRDLARRARIVLAGNEYLAGWMRAAGASDVRIVPTAVDTERFAPVANPVARGERFVIGWTGTHANLKYVANVAGPLAAFLAVHPGAVLRICADRPAPIPGIPAARIEFVPWSPESEARVVQGFDVGLMPLTDDAWTRGKCSFKMIQYLACGVPALASPVGMNAEVFAAGDVGLAPRSPGEWRDALEYCHAHPEALAAWGRRGRELVLERYAVTSIVPRLVQAFHDAAVN